MARRNSKAENAIFGLAVVVGLPAFAALKLFESVGWVLPTMCVVSALALYLWYRGYRKFKRLSCLRQKYGDEDVVQKIYQGFFWQGQTQEQLLESLGAPEAVDNNVLRTKIKEVWKYHPRGANRYALRITVENGHVSGWDNKS
jgi:hypothetical protein